MIWVFLPAFNEELSLPKLVPKIANELNKNNLDFKIIVLDDGSIDNTPNILKEFKIRTEYNLNVLTHTLNRGLGETERDGFEYISENCENEDIIVRVESDDTHDPKYIIDLVNKIKEGYDVVNTSRFQKGGDQIGFNNYRKFISRCANIFMKLIFNIKGLKDYSCGFRAYRGEILKDAVKLYENELIQLKGLGFTSTLEIIVKLHLMGAKFSEVPFVLRYDLKESESKMIGSITMLGYFTMAILYRWPIRGWKSIYKYIRLNYKKNPHNTIEKFKLLKKNNNLKNIKF